MILACVCLAMSAGGCDAASKGCTNIGCQDSFGATVRTADGSFPSGAHRIEVLAGSASLTCTFVYPLEISGGGAVQPSCGADLTVMVWPETIPGKFYETISLSGTPGQVHVWQYVDDVAVLDAAVAPSYQSVAPNGPECGPICRQASVTWTFN